MRSAEELKLIKKEFVLVPSYRSVSLNSPPNRFQLNNQSNLIELNLNICMGKYFFVV